MLYQTIRSGARPYLATVIGMHEFPEHRHADLELVYCVRGFCEIGIDKTRYRLVPGDLAIIGSMIPHMTCENNSNDCLTLTIIAGPMFLMDYFEPLAKKVFHDPIFHLGESTSRNQALAQFLDEIANLRRKPTDFSELIVKGNLYKVFGYILTHLTVNQASEPSRKNIHDVSKIEQALDLIYAEYTEPLTVAYVAEKIGYGKSNFCKVFKKITGSTFHAALNERRLDCACRLLLNTALPVEDIAMQVGFADVKTFCRVFKNAYGITARDYRKSQV